MMSNRISDEDIGKARLLTREEIQTIAHEAIKFSKRNPSVPDAYRLRFEKLAGALSGRKVAEAQKQADDKEWLKGLQILYGDAPDLKDLETRLRDFIETKREEINE